MKRDFTWVQSIAILFDNHQLFVGALKTATWEDYIDCLALTFDYEPITLHESEGATWTSSLIPSVSIVRTTSTNNVIMEVEGRLRVTTKVVPIAEEDSRIHNYGITKEDCFAHLDLGFKFFTLNNEVSGVLGQTYKPNYVSRLDVGAKMPVMGGGK
ncbi:Root cap [Spatholobus suberectus]|nr:Root cap [Spatholobus suberectus]